MKLFGKHRVEVLLDTQRNEQIRKHNEKVKENREILKRLIDDVCFLAKQELPFRGHNESEDSLNKGNYVELLEILRTYDPLLDNHLKNATTFRGTSNDIQNDLADAVCDVILDEIKQRVASADFVSLELDETSDVNKKSQLSTIFRYVGRDGIPTESFIGFTDVSADRTAEGIFNHVTNIVEEYNAALKLIAQTYDGASVMSGHLSGLQTRVKEAYPKALFTHCYAHVLNLVLQQSLSEIILECSLFFKTLSGIPKFFSKSSKRSFALQDFMSRKLPSVAPTRWNFMSRLVNTVHEFRAELLEFFESILDDSDSWDAKAILKARGFVQFLTEFRTVFLLEVFANIFSYTDVLYDILQTDTVDIAYCHQKVRDTADFLKRDRNEGFEKIWAEAKAKHGGIENPRPLRNRSGLSAEEECRRLYREIHDTIVAQIDARYGSVLKLQFCHLLSHQKFVTYRTDFPTDKLDSLKDAYGNLFDYVKLKTELTVLYKSDEFLGLPPYKLIQFLRENDLTFAFKEVNRLAALLCTIPATTASVERSFSALKRIHTYCRSTQTQGRLSSLSVIAIEKGILQELRAKEDFYDTVIQKFLAKTRRIELNYM
nr:PREDICTED: zinc finger MYM-type protein 1-like [Bemisia tabaci]